MRRIDTLVIGAGQAGLAVSWHLVQQGIDHVVLERGRVANAWSTERWDSLRMITPNWMSRLPGWSYRGPDPDGYMSAAEVAHYLGEYRRSFGAPVIEGVEVLEAGTGGDGFEVRTSDASWRARHLVVATGAAGRPYIPPFAGGLAPSIHQLPLRHYRRPAALPAGGVLVVGASASGLAVADELAADGRDVVLSVGGHAWLPRAVAGRDIWAWLEASGWLGRTVDEVGDVGAVRREPRLQLLGRRGQDFGLAASARRGVTLVGRLSGGGDTTVRFSDDLSATQAQARRRSADILAGVAAAAGVPDLPLPPAWPTAGAPRELDLVGRGIRTIVWAAGHRPYRPWLTIPGLDPAGELCQRRGRTAVPGLYVVGTKFQHRRDSTFLDGVRHDAHAVVEDLAPRRRPVPVAPRWSVGTRMAASVTASVVPHPRVVPERELIGAGR